MFRSPGSSFTGTNISGYAGSTETIGMSKASVQSFLDQDPDRQVTIHRQRLRRRREMLGLSQGMLAKKFKEAHPKVKLAQSDISRWERGASTTNYTRFSQLANFLAVTEEWLMGTSKVMTPEGRTEVQEQQILGIDPPDPVEEVPEEEAEGTPTGSVLVEGEDDGEEEVAPVATFKEAPVPALPTHVDEPVRAPVKAVKAPEPPPAPAVVPLTVVPATIVAPEIRDIFTILQEEVLRQMVVVGEKMEATSKCLEDGAKAVGDAFGLCEVALDYFHQAERADVTASIRGRIMGQTPERTSDKARTQVEAQIDDLERVVTSVITNLRRSIAGGMLEPKHEVVAQAPIQAPVLKVVPAPKPVEVVPEEPKGVPPVVQAEEDPEEDEPEEVVAKPVPEVVKVPEVAKEPPKLLLVIGGHHAPHPDAAREVLNSYNFTMEWIQTDGNRSNQIDSAVRRILNPARTVSGVVIVGGGSMNHTFSTQISCAAKMAGTPTVYANNQATTQMLRSANKIATDLAARK